MYKALMRAAWSRFETLTDHLENMIRVVNDALTGHKNLCDDICQAESQDKLRSESFSELTELFDQYFNYLKETRKGFNN